MEVFNKTVRFSCVCVCVCEGGGEGVSDAFLGTYHRLDAILSV